MNGEGVEQEIARGCYWIHLAARHGYPLAQYNLGVMYFDGIGGTYSRPVTARECDRLPEWSRHGHPAAISALPEGDINTERMVLVQDPSENEAAAHPVSEVPETETGTVSDAVTETVAAPGLSETETGTEDTDGENTPETVIRSDTTSAGEVTESETGNPDAEVSLSAASWGGSQSAKAGVGAGAPEVPVAADDGGAHTDMTSADAGGIPVPDEESSRTTGKESTDNQGAGAAALSGTTGKNTEVPADSLPEKPVILKPQEIRPAVVPPPALNLGGSPATAPGRHYTLQLSGGTTAEELYRTARRHKLTNYVVYETVRRPAPERAVGAVSAAGTARAEVVKRNSYRGLRVSVSRKHRQGYLTMTADSRRCGSGVCA
ncbi:hypothetical protein A3Q29_20155 [Providencia stuartii]|uniref:Uncharacterized protein n=1 Tax=Providencia stuartii TaxID=588 RepID=A0A1S1HNW5_PROST|nr:hypothetical protein A3Q29_20155 [Providencia stuartii]